MCKLLQSYYNVYGVQQFPGYYGQYAQSIQAQGFGIQYPQMAQFPFLPQHYGSTDIFSYPSSVVVPTTSAGNKSNAKNLLFLLVIFSFLFSNPVLNVILMVKM